MTYLAFFAFFLEKFNLIFPLIFCFLIKHLEPLHNLPSESSFNFFAFLRYFLSSQSPSTNDFFPCDKHLSFAINGGRQLSAEEKLMREATANEAIKIFIL